MTNFKISIVSDTVCPWCYVGKKKLERGISLYKSARPNTTDTFTITWHPYYLNPQAPIVGVDKRQYHETILGAARVPIIFARMEAIGKELGIGFKFGGKTGATRESHRLIALGLTKGAAMQTRVVEELFEAYFEHEEDITSWDVLRRRGVRAGLDEEEISAWLKSGAGGDDVDREVEEARQMGISGVPNFTLQGAYEIGGAQEAEAFERVFDKIKASEVDEV